MVCPVRYSASSLTRNATTDPMSSAVLPTRLLGTDSAMTIELRLARNRRDSDLGRPALCLATLVIDAA